jgi:ABC-type multidrug transport system ATPase subunit
VGYKKESSIKCSNVSKRNSSVKNENIVKDIRFEVLEGSIMGLIGPSGAGKSTIFKMLALMSKRNGGTI